MEFVEHGELADPAVEACIREYLGDCADRPPEALFSDEPLLERCGLARPLLFRAGRAAGLSPLPRTIEAFEQAVSRGGPGDHPGRTKG